MTLQEQIQSREEFLEALKKGKTVQRRNSSVCVHDWVDVGLIWDIFDYDVQDLRVKPVDPYQVFRDAEAEGKTIQVLDSHNKWKNIFWPAYNLDPSKYRIKNKFIEFAEAIDKGARVECSLGKRLWTRVCPNSKNHIAMSQGQCPKNYTVEDFRIAPNTITVAATFENGQPKVLILKEGEKIVGWQTHTFDFAN